jgi:hypothetical protein
MKHWYVYEEKTYEVYDESKKDERRDHEGLGEVRGLLNYGREIQRKHKKKTSGDLGPFDFRPDTVPVTAAKKKGVEGKKRTVKKSR